jgi:hypothetical protein
VREAARGSGSFSRKREAKRIYFQYGRNTGCEAGGVSVCAAPTNLFRAEPQRVWLQLSGTGQFFGSILFDNQPNTRYYDSDSKIKDLGVRHNCRRARTRELLCKTEHHTGSGTFIP